MPPTKHGLTRQSHLTILILAFCFLIVILSLSVFNIAYSFAPVQKNVLGAQKETYFKDQLLRKKFWLSFLNSNPNYLPGWIELAKIESRLGNLQAANEAFETAQKIDPNSELLNNLGLNLY